MKQPLIKDDLVCGPCIKVLGTPTREEIHAMNPNYTEFKFPQIKVRLLTSYPGLYHLSFTPTDVVMVVDVSIRGGFGIIHNVLDPCFLSYTLNDPSE